MLTHKTQADAVLFLLKREQAPTTSDFCAYLYRHPDGSVRGLGAEYRRTMTDLRKLGYDIQYHQGSKGQGWYTLEQEPATVSANGQLVLCL